MGRGRNRDSEQLDMQRYFDVPREPAPQPGSSNFTLQLRNALSRALKETPHSRVDVAARMTDLLFGDAGDGEVTKAQLDRFTAPSAEAWRFPLEFLPAFVQVTGAVWLLDLVAERCGCRILEGEQALLAELGAIILHERRLKSARARLEKSVPSGVLDTLIKRIEAGDA